MIYLYYKLRQPLNTEGIKMATFTDNFNNKIIVRHNHKNSIISIDVSYHCNNGPHSNETFCAKGQDYVIVYGDLVEVKGARFTERDIWDMFGDCCS